MADHVDLLIQQLHAENPDIQQHSALELGKRDLSSHRQEVIETLCALLGHAHLRVREAAEEALLQIGGKDVVEALIPSIASASTTIVNYAIEILSKIGDAAIENIVELLNSRDHDVRKFGCDILGHLNCGDYLYDLVELLNDPHINVAIAAGEALGNLGEPEAVPYLIRALQHPDTWMRCIAAEALGKIGDPRAIDAFVKISSEEDPIVLYSVIKALGRLSDERVAPYIISVLQSNPMLAASSVQLIEGLAARYGESVYAQLNTAGVTAAIVRLLSNEHSEVLRSAIRLVGQLHVREAIQPLETLLHHDHKEVVGDAIAALVRIEGPEIVASLLQKLLTQTTQPDINNLFQQTLTTLQHPQGA